MRSTISILGGWLMITNVELNDLSKQESMYGFDKMPLSGDVQTLGDVETGNFGLNGVGIADLHSIIKFDQVRIYCKKKNTSIHIVSKQHRPGLVNYLIMNGDCPIACGTYKILSDDNSYISHHCNELVAGNFGNCNIASREPKMRIYDHLMYTAFGKHILLLSTRMECDDYNVKSTGVWKFFVR